jgi:hypothetical protein
LIVYIICIFITILAIAKARNQILFKFTNNMSSIPDQKIISYDFSVSSVVEDA